MKLPHKKEVREIVKSAMDAGFTFDYGSGAHHKLRAPDGELIVISSTPSWGGVTATKALVRKAARRCGVRL